MFILSCRFLMILEGGVVLFVGIDGDFLVFGDGNCWLLCWSTFIVSDGEGICVLNGR